MATEDLLVDNRSHRQTVEAVGKGLPQLYVVSPFTCEVGGGGKPITWLRSNLGTKEKKE